jgi:hypothetical protein
VVAAVTVLVLAIGGAAGARALSGGDQHKKPGPTGPSAPAIQKATGEELLAVDLTPAAPTGTFALGSRKAGVAIEGLQPVETFGVGAEKRSAPDGGALVAFRLGNWPCEVPTCRDWRTLGLVVRVGDQVRKLPTTGSSFVVAVPAGTASVDLVTEADGYPQSLSLLTGAPGARNIAVLARGDRVAQIDKTFTVTETWSQRIQSGYGAGHNLFDRKVRISTARLSFFVPGRRRPAPGRAYLEVNATYSVTSSGRTINAGPIDFSSDMVSFTGPDGTSYPPRFLGERKEGPNVVFEVPANLTGGTFTVGSSAFHSMPQSSLRLKLEVERTTFRF